MIDFFFSFLDEALASLLVMLCAYMRKEFVFEL